MTTPLLLRSSLIIGHAAVALLALTGIPITLPGTPLPQWHVAGQPGHPVTQAPRRIPAARRSEQPLDD